MKIVRLVLAIMAIVALGAGCSDLPSEPNSCPTQGGPHCSN
jgi:hypothetical protein